MFDSRIDEFLTYRRSARNSSAHTLKAYEADLRQLRVFTRQTRSSGELPTLADLRAFLASLHDSGAARATIARKQAAVRSFFRWARRAGHVTVDPSRGLYSRRSERTLPKFL